MQHDRAFAFAELDQATLCILLYALFCIRHHSHYLDLDFFLA